MDITDRKMAEEELQRAYTEIKLLKDRLMAENVYLRDEIGAKHPVSGVVTANAGFEELPAGTRFLNGS